MAHWEKSCNMSTCILMAITFDQHVMYLFMDGWIGLNWPRGPLGHFGTLSPSDVVEFFISPKGCLMQWIRHYSERYWSCQMICWKNWSGVLIWNKTVPFLPVKSSTGIKYPAKTIIFGYCPILLKIISQTNKYLCYDLQLGSYINLDTEHHPKILSQFYRLIRPGPHGNWKKVTSAPDNPLKGSNWIRNISQGYFMQ